MPRLPTALAALLIAAALGAQATAQTVKTTPAAGRPTQVVTEPAACRTGAT